jgi:hypothetical protein
MARTSGKWRETVSMEVRVIRVAALVSCLLIAQAGAVFGSQGGGSQEQASATTTGAQRSDQVTDARLKYRIGLMEGILERAVQHGAFEMTRRLQVSPDMLLLGGPPRARGFQLEGYGVFFDVEVPELRRSVAWTFRMLDEDALGLNSALSQLRSHVQSVTDQRARLDLEQAIKRLEIQVGFVSPGERRSGAPREVAAGVKAQAGASAAVVPTDPDEAYTAEVRVALVEALLDHAFSIEPHQWFTVAARGNDRGLLSANHPYEVMTLILRIRGEDLIAFREGRISREEARGRVEAKDF